MVRPFVRPSVRDESLTLALTLPFINIFFLNLKEPYAFILSKQSMPL